MAALVAPFAGKYAAKFGHARILFAGSIMLSVGTFGLTTFIPIEPSYLTQYLPWMLLTGFGVGLSISTLSSSATAYLKPTQFAMGSALNTTARQIGTALGAALSLAIAAPALGRIEAARRAGTALELIDMKEIHAAWIMNGFVYLAAGITMITIFRKPTEAQMDDARVTIKFED
jgi:MFS family permease